MAVVGTQNNDSWPPLTHKTRAIIAKISLAGAIAYDHICTTQTSLKNDGASSRLNLKLDSQTATHGGCGANIAFNLSQMGHEVDLYSSTGKLDDAQSLKALADLGINTRGILRVAGADTAQATIITDPAGIQFTAFYPGPHITLSDWRTWLTATFTMAGDIFVQAPQPANLMLAGVEHAVLLGAEVIWCPGQYADQLLAAEVATILPYCSLLVGNQHEISFLSKIADFSHVSTIQSAGKGPVTISTPRQHTTVEIPGTNAAVDPTGCGDALVAGIAHYLANYRYRSPNDAQLEQAVRCGIEFAQYCIKATGSQAHSLAAILKSSD